MNIILSGLPKGIGKGQSVAAGLAGDSRGLTWEVGEILQGRVSSQVAQDAFFLEIQGREILARSSLSLVPGQAVSLQVQERQGSQWLVKLLAAGGPVLTDDLKTLLTRLGLQDTPLYRSLVAKFLAYRLPLQPELLRQVEQVLSLPHEGGQAKIEASLPEGATAANDHGLRAIEGEIEVALQALKLGVPPQAESINYLRAFMLQEQEKGQEGITSLARFLSSLAAVLDGLEGEKGGAARTLFQQLKAMVASLILQPGAGRERLAGQLHNLLFYQLPGRDDGDFSPTHNGGVLSLPPLPESAAGKELQQGPTRYTRSWSLNELTTKLDSLLQAVKEAVRENGQETAARDLLHTGEKIAGQLAGQQVFQTSGKDNGLQACLYFTLPIQQEGEVTTWGQLVIRKEGQGANQVDSRNFNMTILLHTENLGSLLLDIRAGQGEVRVQGQVEEEWVGELIAAFWPDLQEVFTGLGYRLHSYQWRTGAVPGQLLPLPVAPGEITIVPGLLDKKV
ncbi:hypothetical protein SDD30_00060 [Moorella naiadis]|uniref:hypothetical protein n=1 Tax=Moorella naiadis (nom. illeg.) TaxID=3093670 RepID=UPI003D9CAAC9